MASVLVVEDQENLRQVLETYLAEDGHEVEGLGDGKAALSVLEKRSYDLVVTDLRLPGADGMEILRSLRKEGAPTAVLIMTAHGSVDGAVDAMRDGADDYLTKPFELKELGLRVAKALDSRMLARQTETLREEVAHRIYGEDILGDSEAMSELAGLLDKVAQSDAPVLIQGESGTGKELAAHAIHKASPRSRGPFVAVHCAALARGLLESELFGHEKGAFTGAIRTRHGKFESAQGGTLFLDEVGDIPQDTQVKLLRIIQEKILERVGSSRSIRLDVRVLAATNKDLKVLVDKGDFREDLFFRLNVLPITLPPLRDRGRDAVVIAKRFLKKRALDGEFSLSPRTEKEILAYSWPGNVRELLNVMERAVVLSQPGELRLDLKGSGGSSLADSGSLKERIQNQEVDVLRDAFEDAGRNQVQAAKKLGLSRTTLQYKLKKYGII